ncbi:MAG: dephospho-CoA kinase [Betaproteobacteria bacterium]|nr:dephospho-CoA kinase [Betaproteobacteria bacterium]
MHRPHPWRIGLTGGIGSGKSTVAGMLAELGATVIDADAISRSLTAPGGRAIDAIRAQFGPDMVGPDGAMDRQAMRTRVFADPQARRRLEAIIHPLVAQITREQTEAAVAAGARCLVHDVPLLVESGTRWRAAVDRVLVVDCEPDTQRQRVAARSGLAADEIERILAQQASRAQRLACADIVVFNQGLSLAELNDEIRQMARHFGL